MCLQNLANHSNETFFFISSLVDIFVVIEIFLLSLRPVSIFIISSAGLRDEIFLLQRKMQFGHILEIFENSGPLKRNNLRSYQRFSLDGIFKSFENVPKLHLSLQEKISLIEKDFDFFVISGSELRDGRFYGFHVWLH